MGNAYQRSPYRVPLRDIASGLVLLAAVVAVRLTWGTMYALIPIGLFILLGAYAIASGGNAKAASRDEADRNWATEVLARPVWLETLALAVNWLSVAIVVMLISFWDVPFEPMWDQLSAVTVIAIPAVAAVALAFVYSVRRQARRVLGTTP
jgi:hypothetical protein